jgi:hypothetical protein
VKLPWPAEQFLTDAAVRVALANADYASIAFIALFASASWVDETGMLTADEPRLAAILGIKEEKTVRDAVSFWMVEGKLHRAEGKLYLPWLTKAKAAETAGAQARSEQAKGAAEARWSAPPPGSNLSLVPAASDEHADGREWPKDYTRVACDVWIARWGAGSAPGDVIAMNLRQIKKAGAPWDAVVRSFQRYVETVEERYASPAAWRKRWRSYDPEEPEHDHEAAEIADSYDRQMRAGRRGGGGLRPVGEALRALPDGKKS